ncbi:phosphatidylinositol-3,4,5-trisphosphate 3-phosphatase [Lindgomyces ingoldianus]|uniref:Phosphatidylinositol-3,4,5-trisphosphate 3-phosphatase n=1 Tax=Lindgomyces ingoldianus TaxID=673940 RepID=A0ACB6QJY3_9PLEO|nr:phosphatidylinositol-3,4,5-trisphosphate 3-phosphatase [Lindgomyces ingoldianus]KAF2467324.1 phosphatidylinositol-3,4,5-trisphosphate 3-phosphatase [Lindgomyces ingoldianus]
MASLLRQIVAGPRARHAEAGLDLCYVTDHIIATSGPSGTYPQRAYRNPLDSLVKFLDHKHGEDWAIWEFRAEGTGYPDDEVYNRVYHYPFPDHHPPPFVLIPHMMASMRNWLKGKKGRVVVVHCKAGKGRSGTASCSYLISEEGWEAKDALKRFTERRMRPGWGDGVSIPSQLRWIGYVERWAKHGKIYVERQVEVLEVHCWGLRDGVKIQVEGFVNDGKIIKAFHTFTRSEREVVRGEIQSTGGFAQAVNEVMGKNGLKRSLSKKEPKTASPDSDNNDEQGVKQASTYHLGKGALLDGASFSKEEDSPSSKENGKGDVVFRPSKRVVLPTNDFNIDVERRNKAAYGLTMVTSVAHVWMNTFFEGNGPEQNGEADESGVFEITWDAMDGIKGSSKKGTRAFDKIAVVWKALKDEGGKPGIVITEPKEGEEVKQTSPADWKGQDNVAPSEEKDLGLRTSSPAGSSVDISKASSVKSQHTVFTAPDPHENSTAGVRSHGLSGEETIETPSSGSGPSGLPTCRNQSPSSASAQLDGTWPAQGKTKPETGGSNTHSPASNHDDVAGIVGGIQHISTGDLPGGRPEEEMKTANEHSLGRLGYAKKTNTGFD